MRSRRREAGTGGSGEQVTPTTAALLQGWFGPEPAQASDGLVFSEGQRQAVLSTISRHETARREHRVAPPRHRLNLPDEVDTIPVVLGLLLWQMLNHTDSCAAGLNDPRFTRHFAVITHHRLHRDRLMNALWGRPLAGGGGARDFSTSDWVRLADGLIPEGRRDEVYAFMCASACSVQGDLIVITDEHLQSPACLARLPRLMVFVEPSRQLSAGDEDTAAVVRKQLRRVVSLHGKPCMEVVLARTPDPHPPQPGPTSAL